MLLIVAIIAAVPLATVPLATVPTAILMAARPMGTMHTVITYNGKTVI